MSEQTYIQTSEKDAGWYARRVRSILMLMGGGEMKKILFNDKFGLTQAVLEGRKTQTSRIIKVQPPYKNFDIAFPVFVEEDWHTF